MSVNLSSAAISSFDDMVKQSYQGQPRVRRSIRTKTGVVGSTHRFTKVGKGTATARIPQTDVVPMNIAYSTATATLTDWNAPEYTDIFNKQKVNFDEQQLLASIIANAIGRREDQLIIDVMDAAATSLTVATTVGGADTNLNTAKMRNSKKLLDAKGVPAGERYHLTHANNIYGLLGDTTATSADFNTIRALVNGELNTWLGFQMIPIEDRDEGGLAISGSVRKNFSYHGGMMGAVGLAVGVDFRTEINYIPEKTSWLANGLYAAGAAAIDTEGLVEMDVTE